MRGLDHIHPSAYHASPDCAICLQPLDLIELSANTEAGKTTHLHAAVRIKSCGHIHGKECLTAWLQLSNTCPNPACNRMLFLPPMEQPLTQEEVDALMRENRDVHSEDVLARALARYIHISDAAAEKAKQVLASKIVLDEAKEKEKEDKDRQEFLLKDEGFFDSDEEVDTGEYAADEEDDEDASFSDGEDVGGNDGGNDEEEEGDEGDDEEGGFGIVSDEE